MNTQAAMIVMGIILTASIGFMGWLAKTVFNISQNQAALNQRVESSMERIRDIEQHGPPSIQGVNIRLEMLAAGQTELKSLWIEAIKELVRDRREIDRRSKIEAE